MSGKSIFHTRDLLAVAAAIPIGACSELVTELKEMRDDECCSIEYLISEGTRLD